MTFMMHIANEKVTIAAEPGDTDETLAKTRLDYLPSWVHANTCDRDQ